MATRSVSQWKSTKQKCIWINFWFSKKKKGYSQFLRVVKSLLKDFCIFVNFSKTIKTVSKINYNSYLENVHVFKIIVEMFESKES